MDVTLISIDVRETDNHISGDIIPLTEFEDLSDDVEPYDDNPKDDVIDEDELKKITDLPYGLNYDYPPLRITLPQRGVSWPISGGGLRRLKYLKRLWISGSWGGSAWPCKGDGSGGTGGGGLDLSGNTDLEVLIIENVYLGTIDLSHNTKLKILILINCGITELDLTQNTQLEYLDCSYNYLRVLNLSVNIYLKYIYCHHNYLPYIITPTNATFTGSGCHSQDLTGELQDNNNTTNPYKFDLRNLVSEDKLVNIDINSIKAYDNSGNAVTFTIQDYVLYFPKVVKLIIYYYRIVNISLEVSITLTYQGKGGEEITPPAPTTQNPPSITTTSVTSGIAGRSYSFRFRGTGTGSLTWRIISGSIPGLKLASDGTLSGTPTAHGTYTIGVSVTDSSTKLTYELYFTITATGSTPITWRLLSGDLPAGISITSTGFITGTPTVRGKFTFTVIAENSIEPDRRTFTLTIGEGSGGTGIKPDIIATYTLKDAIVGVWYSAALYAEGTRAISWRLTSGSLPAGLTLNTSEGTITGTPRGTGQYTFTVEALNSWGTNIAIFVINVYANNTNIVDKDTTTTTIVYEYMRTIYSLTEYELSMLPSSIYIIAAVLPRFRVVSAGTYTFTVNIYDTVPAGLKLVWFPFAVSGSGGGSAIFLNMSRQEITLSPDNRRLIVSVYLEAGTYAPVIAVLRPSEEEKSPDVEPAADGGGGGGGCSYGMGSLVLVAVAGLAFFRKR